ncbi:MAG TPA: sialidase family protein [Acidimicrobiia bacterium]|nr:sialidase family protein [Acidimicrobiia bacterium]
MEAFSLVERKVIGLNASESRRLAIVITALLFAVACSTQGVPLEGDAAVWVTTDGVSWSRVIDPDLGGPGTQQMTGIAKWDRGLVAVGSSALHDRDYDGQIWLSEDGSDWTVVTDPDLGGPDNQHINTVVTAGPGLIAIGHSNDGGDLDVVIWTSTDGVEWERVRSPILGGRGDQVTWPFGNPVTVTDDLIVLSGMDGDDAAVWTSADGHTWSRVENAEMLGGVGEQNISKLVVAGPGWLAVGWDDLDASVWTSSDGTTWERARSAALGGPGGQRMTAVMATGDGFVAVGDSVSYEEIYFLGRGSRGTSNAAVWISADGLEWERVDGLDELGDQHMYNVGVVGSTLLAVGIDSPDPRTRGLFEAGPSSGRDVDAAVWTSDDGRSWTKARSEALGGQDWQDIFDLAEFDGTIVAVGGDDVEGSSGG